VRVVSASLRYGHHSEPPRQSPESFLGVESFGPAFSQCETALRCTRAQSGRLADSSPLQSVWWPKVTGAGRVTAEAPHRGPPLTGARARAPKRRGADNAPGIIGRARECERAHPEGTPARGLHREQFREVSRPAARVTGRDARGPTCPRAPHRSAVRGPAQPIAPSMKDAATAWPLPSSPERPRRGGILITAS
jgi:hypothetical protein